VQQPINAGNFAINDPNVSDSGLSAIITWRFSLALFTNNLNNSEKKILVETLGVYNFIGFSYDYN
jgi:hypothetical protein